MSRLLTLLLLYQNGYEVGKFTSTDVIESCPAAGRSSVLRALKKLTDEGLIIKMGNGRSTSYVRSDAAGKRRFV